ncbi:alpha/beta fold hydrolase [Kocuria marina]|uniref:alpha/beta fold hydrolase n=1 Tax=Kocuria marina TaxID=223184 RepID=UPI00272DC827
MVLRGQPLDRDGRAHRATRTPRGAAPSDVGGGAPGHSVDGPRPEPIGTGETQPITATWVFVATGYYGYDRPHIPDFAGVGGFRGQLVHPQFWPEDLDVRGKKVAVIGSGATAVTLLPELVTRGAETTMVQRTPSYILPLPSPSVAEKVLFMALGRARAARVMRPLMAAGQRALWVASKAAPRVVRAGIAAVNRRRLPADVSVREHFTPPYDPWDQRLCVAPNGDFFAALHEPNAHIVTAGIDRFDADGLVLTDGRRVAADVVVSATGFDLLMFGGARLSVDGRPVNLPERIAYRGAMLSDVPNLAFAIGYTNGSWTLKIGLVVDWLSRLIAHTDSVGAASVRPVAPEGLRTRPLLDFDAGYVQRSLDQLPRQGDTAPWRMAMNYFDDRRQLLRKPVVDRFLRFDDAAAPVPEQLPALLTGPGESGEERTVQLDDDRFICVRLDGPSDGAPLVLITGLAFDLATWPMSFVHALADRGYRVIRLDNRDVGRSFRVTSTSPSARRLLRGPLPEGQYSVEDMSEDVADTLRALGVERADVMGFSLGGMIAQSLAGHHPELVRRLISLCSTTGDPSVGTAATSTAALLMFPGAKTRDMYIRGRLVMSHHLAGPGFPVDVAYERQLAATHWDRSLDPRGEAEAMRRQIGAIRSSGDRTEVLSRITAPTLVIHGDKDKIVRPDGGPATAEVIPHARFVRIPGMGHQVHPMVVPRLFELVIDHLGDPREG